MTLLIGLFDSPFVRRVAMRRAEDRHGLMQPLLAGLASLPCSAQGETAAGRSGLATALRTE